MNRFTTAFQQADSEFNEQYSQALKYLKEELSETEIQSIVPQGTNAEEYKKLIAVIEDATNKNMSQAELITKIKSMGDIVVKIAKKIPALASLFKV